jgi:universal stress protein E
MKRFKNISLIYECDQSTLERAALLAKENHARLTIVHAIKEFPTSWQHLYVDDKPVDVKKLVMQDQQESLEEMASSLHSLGVHPKTRLLEGVPFVEIIRDVVENERDLVIMTVDKKPGWREYFFGNTVSAMMRDCPCPVLALKPSGQKSFKKILVAVDPVLVGDSHDTLNKVILELASSLAELEDAELHVVNAWRLVGESMMRGRLSLPKADVDRAVLHEFGKHRDLVQDLLVKNGITSQHVHLPKGDAVHAIPELVKELAADLLVMGTVCRTGIPGFIIGNTAEQVLGAVECSTLTVKPEGFVSPVTPHVST